MTKRAKNLLKKRAKTLLTKREREKKTYFTDKERKQTQ